MNALSLPWTDATLSLHPRWGEAAGIAHIWPWLLVGALPLALILWLTRYELRLVSRAAAVGLLLLRLCVLFLVLFLIGLQPVVARPEQTPEAQRVLIAVDLSESMDVADPERQPVDKLRLARALHLARGVCSDLQLDEWIEQHGTPAGPLWVTADEYANDGERRRQLAAERRRQHDEVCKRADALTRTAVGQRILSADGAGLLNALSRKYQIEIVGFAGELWDGQADQLDELWRRPVKDRRGDYTDLRLPLNRALTPTSANGSLRGVILLTDGQHNPRTDLGIDTSPVELADMLGKQKAPIFPIGLGARPQGLERRTPAPPDVVVTVVRAPEVILKDAGDGGNTNTTVEATIRVSGLPAQAFPVQVELDGKVLDQKTIAHNGKDQDYPLSFSVSLTQEGTQKLTVRVPPVPGESYPGNNSRSLAVKVVEDYAEVLLIDGAARWEYHYLASALGRDPLVSKLDRVLFEQPRLDTNADEQELQKAGYASRTMPRQADGLAGYDCIILGDVSPAQLPAGERQRLEEYVGSRGGTLVIVAGKQFMPLAFQNEADGGATDPLLKLLPITQPQVVKPEDGFPLVLTDEGRRGSLLQMEDNPFLQWGDQSEPRQRHFWAVAGHIKPGGTALAYYGGDAAEPRKNDRAFRKRQQDEQAVIVRQTYGKGRVFYVGIDSTWRWRYKTGDRLHHHFWGQLVRWAAADKLVEGGNAQVRFGTTKARYSPGQEVDLLLRLGHEQSPLAVGAPARVRVLRRTEKGEEAVAVVPMTPRPHQPRVLDGHVRDLAAGEYRLELDVPALADKLAQSRAATFEVVAPESKEMVELAPDWDLLDKLAATAQNGGRVFSAENAPELVELLTRQEEQAEKHPENRLWEWWPTLVLLLVLLTAEWTGRKWAGLP